MAIENKVSVNTLVVLLSIETIYCERAPVFFPSNSYFKLISIFPQHSLPSLPNPFIMLTSVKYRTYIWSVYMSISLALKCGFIYVWQTFSKRLYYTVNTHTHLYETQFPIQCQLMQSNLQLCIGLDWYMNTRECLEVEKKKT